MNTNTDNAGSNAIILLPVLLVILAVLRRIGAPPRIIEEGSVWMFGCLGGLFMKQGATLQYSHRQAQKASGLVLLQSHHAARQLEAEIRLKETCRAQDVSGRLPRSLHPRLLAREPRGWAARDGPEGNVFETGS